MRDRSGRPAADFDFIAVIYRWAEYLLLGQLLERCREGYLDACAGRNQALALGDGDGRFLARLLNAYPDLRATAVDSSEKMLRLLRRRCPLARLQTLHAHLPDLPFAACTPKPDLVITHFFLDCLSQTECDLLAGQLAEVCRPGTLWLVSDFGVATGSPWRILSRWYVRALYGAFGALTGLQIRQLPDHAKALESAGFMRRGRQTWLRGLVFTELWERSSITTNE